MAYNEAMAERIRKLLARRKGLAERKMFGGIAFMLNGNMCCGVVDDRIVLRPAARGRSLEGRAQGSSGCRREVRSGTMFFHRDRRRTKPAARTPLRPKGYGETGPSSLLPTPSNECALSRRRLLESGPVWP